MSIYALDADRGTFISLSSLFIRGRLLFSFWYDLATFLTSLSNFMKHPRIVGLLSICLFVFLATALMSTNLFAQRWIPDGINGSKVLVERFKYQDPEAVLYDIDDMYEDQRDEFIEQTNSEMDSYNVKLDELLKALKVEHASVPIGQVDEKYPDKSDYRYLLRREPFFGRKTIYDSATKATKDESYFAYRYYFVDRKTKEEYPPYYFSGDQWTQIKRIVFWLNQAK